MSNLQEKKQVKKKKGFISRIIKNIDKKMVEKSKKNSCCNDDKKSKGSSCC